MNDIYDDTRMAKLMAREPIRHIHLQPVGHMEDGSQVRHSRTASLGRHAGREAMHNYRVKDNIYNKTLSWLKNLKPWTKLSSSPGSSNGDKDSLCYNNATSGRNIRSSKSDRNLAEHLRNCSFENNDDSDSRISRKTSGRSSSLKRNRTQSQYLASIYSDRDYFEPHTGDTDYQQRYDSANLSSYCDNSLTRDYGNRPQGASVIGVYRNNKSQDTIYQQSRSHNHDPLNHPHINKHEHNYTQQHLCSHQAVAARNGELQLRVDGFSTRSQSSNGQNGLISSLSRDSSSITGPQGDQVYDHSYEHPDHEGRDQDNPPLTNTQAAAVVSGSTVTRILREKLFGRAKSSININLDHGTKHQQHQQAASREITSSSSSHSVGVGESGAAVVKLRSKKCKPLTSDHVYVVNREDKISRPRSCATLPHYVKLGVVHEIPRLIGDTIDHEDVRRAAEERYDGISPVTVRLRNKQRRLSQEVTKRLSLPADIRLPENFLAHQSLSLSPDGQLTRRSRRKSLPSESVE